ncbi:hypothetical protein Micbo1qcDRAFT_157440 [Microdochium bolleyi]|uniref:Uncharacterized protein n=1 Tax=Microdochium bolleyi TaxID=196109 RepID=A0A136JEB5_9PEZI|nr:hypothetical protein Micbo1qcDRAFT_157440 [Microdochium bolleyi]
MKYWFFLACSEGAQPMDGTWPRPPRFGTVENDGMFYLWKRKCKCPELKIRGKLGCCSAVSRDGDTFRYRRYPVRVRLTADTGQALSDLDLDGCPERRDGQCRSFGGGRLAMWPPCPGWGLFMGAHLGGDIVFIISSCLSQRSRTTALSRTT